MTSERASTGPSQSYMRIFDVAFREANERVIEQFAGAGYVVVLTSDLRRCLDSANEDKYARERLMKALDLAETALARASTKGQEHA